MWEAPNREHAGPAGDALGGTPDSSRPANPWPRLLAFAATVIASVVLAGICVGSFANPPKRELKIPIPELAVGLPRFVAVTTFGADKDGLTYGAWVTALPQGQTIALLSLGPASRCNLKWEPTAQAGNQTGVYVDRCSAARFDLAGAVIEGGAARDLDAFPTRRTATAIYVDVTQVTLGRCRDTGARPCSTPDRPATRHLPQDALPADFPR